jgi:transcriptional regulator with XRE-family HTH domain
MPTKSELGKRVREERVRQALTLKQVEHRAGVSATHISQIERGITWPTVNALHKIATALAKNTSFFLEEVELPEVSMVSGERVPIVLSEMPRVLMKPLTNGIPGGKFHFYMLIADPSGAGSGYTPDHVHEGDECGCVLSGHLKIRVGDEVFDLREGDAIHFGGTKMHGIRNVGDTVSKSIWTAVSLGF